VTSPAVERNTRYAFRVLPGLLGGRGMWIVPSPRLMKCEVCLHNSLALRAQ